MKQIYFLALGLTFAAAPVNAQVCSHASSPTEAEEERRVITPKFYSSDPANAAERGDVIDLLPSTAPSYVVRDEHECSRALQRAIPFMRMHDPVWAAGEEGNYTANVYRFGPYLVVMIIAEQPHITATATSVELPAPRGGGLLIVYRARGLKFLRAFR